jgi:hypothetical protein
MPDDPQAEIARRLAAARNGTIIFKSATELPMEKIDWLWPGWLARGKLHLLAGAKSTGKSTILFDLAARLTTGKQWPDGAQGCTGDVMIWSGEDGISDTIIPRFVAAGGDRARLHFPIAAEVGGLTRPFDPSADVEALVAAAADYPGLALVGIDPVVLMLPTRADSHKNAETRRGLQPLVDLAESRHVAIVGISHFTKGSQANDPVERVTGSLAFGALPRVVWGASADEDGGQRRLVRISSNIGVSGGGIEYTLGQALLPDVDFGAQCVNWGVQVRGTARELLNADRRSAQSEAAAFLRTYLAEGAKPATEVKTAATAFGHSLGTLRLAQVQLGIRPYKNGRSSWYWKLPEARPPF